MKVTIALLLAALCSSSYGQHAHDGLQCSRMKSHIEGMKTAGKTTVASSEEEKYDMKYVKLDLEMTNTTTTLGGSVITTAQVVAPSMSAYVFEMKSPLVLDSVHIDGVLHTATSTGDLYTVPFGTAMTSGTMFTAQVFYHGTPVSGTSASIYGISSLVSPSWGKRATFTLSQPYSAKDWWPCKQSLQDKIDSADIWITVADSLKAGSNGLLAAITPMGGSRNRYEWRSRYPIDYYLISASVANYTDYSFYMHFTGSPDSMLVQNYIYNTPGVLTAFKSVIDSTAQQVDYFSQLFGRYPFWREKYGHSMAPLSGGMEHQTMTTLGFFQSWLVAHELGHQWFGDNVTCATWADITMNEGFASYCEYLYLDHFRTHAAATADMVDRQDNVMNELGGAVYVDDTTTEDRVFSSRLSYDKGACAIHTLRQVIGNDTYFFDLLRGWQTSKQYSTGTIAEFRDLTKTMLGATVNDISIDTFFKQWFYGEGFPAYKVKWNKSGSDVIVSVSQATTVPSSVPLFKVPLELKFKSATGDTVVKFLNDQPTHLLHFTWSKAMNGIEIDPNNWLTDSVTDAYHDFTLGVPGYELDAVSIFPNPGTTQWTVAALPADCELTLTDITGKELWQATANGRNTMNVPAQSLAPGMYLLRISSADATRVYKVIKE